MKNKIPDRWLEYSPMGNKVAGTRFIAFKAPLGKEICAKMKPADRFTPDILMERCPNMRLIIDLTNTDRYYNKQEFIDRGIQYEKIMCPGQVIPPPSLIFRFFEIIDDFYLKNGLKDVLIGIHCTHGVNRTGYFIGRYMVQRMGFHYEKAIPCIEEARGHKIERPNYIKDLMVQVPIPSSLSSSSGKKILESKPEQKRVSNPNLGKTSKMIAERAQEKPYSRKPVADNREMSARNRRSPDPNSRMKEQSRPGNNFGSSGGRPSSPMRRGPSPGRRPYSPVKRGASPFTRRGVSPGRRPASPPGRRGGRPPSPKRTRTPPRSYSPRRRTPPRRSPVRRFSPPRREADFGPPTRGNDERNIPRNVPQRNYSPSRRMDPPSNNFPPRGAQENQNYGPPHSSGQWNQHYENRSGFNSGGQTHNYGAPSQNQFSDSRVTEKHHSWDSRNNPSSFNDSKPNYGGSALPPQWNTLPPPHDFSRPPPNLNVPPPNMEARPGGFNNPPPGRFNERRFDEPKFPPPRDETRRWNEDRANNLPGPPFNSGRFEQRGFSDRGNEYRQRTEEKYDNKAYNRSPPREIPPPRGDYSREKRPPSPFREHRRDFNSGQPRSDDTWGEGRRRSPVPSFNERDPYNRAAGRKRSRSPARRSPIPRRSRSPRRRSPPKNFEQRRSPPKNFEQRRSPPKNFEQRRSPPRNRSGDHPPSFNPPIPVQHEVSLRSGPPQRSVPEQSYHDKRFYESRDDCRDLLNQKRSFDGSERSNFYEEAKAPKLGVRDIPKEIDLRKIIGGGPNEPPPMKHRLGPPPRDDHHNIMEADGRGRGRAPSPNQRNRSPPRYGSNNRRY